MRAKKPREALQVEVVDPRDDNKVERGELVEELTVVVLDEIFPDLRVYIGSLLSKD